MLSNVSSKLHHLFIPSERNNFRAKLVHIDFLTFYLCLSLFVSFSYRIIATNNLGAVLGIATDITIDRLYEIVNQERAKQGIPTLKTNGQLTQAACAKANYMCEKNLWAHYGTDGTSPWSFISGAGYSYRLAGENLAKDFDRSDLVVAGWMNSETHRQNILRKEYEDVGYCAKNCPLGGAETTLVVQMFGTPQGSQNSVVAQAKAQEPKSIPTTRPTKTPLTQAPLAKIELTASSAPIIAAADSASKGSPTDQKPIIALSTLPFNLSFTLFSLLMIALFFDFYFAHKLGAMRVVGKHMAHFIFLAFALVSLFIVTGGSIL